MLDPSPNISLMALKCLVCRLLLCLLLLYSCEQAAGSSSPLCYKRTLADMVSLREDQCSLHGYEDRTSRVIQVDGHNIDKILSQYYTGGHEYAVVLFYARWCPFSRIMRQMFNSLSASFPGIHHIAIESSALWPSALSRHGVHSLPHLLMHNNKEKVHFHGSRTLEAIEQFYTDITGFLPIFSSYTFAEADTIMRSQQGKDTSWHKSLLLWLHDDIYLAFAIVFLMLRLLIYGLPKIWVSIRQYWSLNQTSHQAQEQLLRQVDAKRRHGASDSAKMNTGKALRKEEREGGKGVLSMQSWSSSSLAPVALAESSSRGIATEDAHERSSIWG